MTSPRYARVRSAALLELARRHADEYEHLKMAAVFNGPLVYTRTELSRALTQPEVFYAGPPLNGFVGSYA